jgi:hypothetical protein
VVPRALAETVALLLLAATLAFAVVRPWGLPEALVAVPAALLTVLLGILPAGDALGELRGLGPTLGFLAAVLLLADLCDREGVFEAAGRRMAAGARGRPVALLGLTLAGFGLASPADVDPGLVAALGAAALAVPALAGGRVRAGDLVRAVALPFLVFVAALGVVVRAAAEGGLGDLVERLVPAGGSLWSLLAVAAVAALLANLVNNLPATLLLQVAPGRGRGGGRRRPGRPARPGTARPGPAATRPRGWPLSPRRLPPSCWSPRRPAWAARPARSAAGAGSSGWWSRPPKAPTCWWWPATATAPASARPALDRPPASWSTMPPARSCWCGPTRPPGSTPSPPHHRTHHTQDRRPRPSGRDGRKAS